MNIYYRSDGTGIVLPEEGPLDYFSIRFCIPDAAKNTIQCHVWFWSNVGDAEGGAMPIFVRDVFYAYTSENLPDEKISYMLSEFFDIGTFTIDDGVILRVDNSEVVGQYPTP